MYANLFWKHTSKTSAKKVKFEKEEQCCPYNYEGSLAQNKI